MAGWGGANQQFNQLIQTLKQIVQQGQLGQRQRGSHTATLLPKDAFSGLDTSLARSHWANFQGYFAAQRSVGNLQQCLESHWRFHSLFTAHETKHVHTVWHTRRDWQITLIQLEIVLFKSPKNCTSENRSRPVWAIPTRGEGSMSHGAFPNNVRPSGKDTTPFWPVCTFQTPTTRPVSFRLNVFSQNSNCGCVRVSDFWVLVSSTLFSFPNYLPKWTRLALWKLPHDIIPSALVRTIFLRLATLDGVVVALWWCGEIGRCTHAWAHDAELRKFVK